MARLGLRLSSLAAVAVLLASATTAAAEPPREPRATWAFRKPIALPALAEPAFVELRLDADVYRSASPTLDDVRVRDASGADVGYAVRRREPVTAEPARETAMLDLVATPQGAVRFVLDAGPERVEHNRVWLRVREQARNFRVPVRVETADETRAWRIVREAGFIYRVEGETKTADTSIAYPGTTARWVRVTVGPEHGRSLPLAGAALVLGPTRAREEERLGATIVQRDEETMRRTTRVVVDLRLRRPADRVELDVAERNFHRVLLLEASDDRKTWRWVGSGAISAVDSGGLRERLTGARFPETTARYLRLTIQNLDEPSLTVTAARVFAARRSLVFEATPGAAYVIEYGNPAATAPRYDVTRALPYLSSGQRLPQATLGASQVVARRQPVAWLASQPVVMWTNMAMAGLVLASLLWRVAGGWRLARAVRAGGGLAQTLP